MAEIQDRAYQVLARKYRPESFEGLVGQDPMVRTLSNAFRTGRIAQAWMLTGVRGVGKTTTARILARALNYSLPDNEKDGPSIDMPEPGEHCQAIMEGRHIDVIEMDAASHTGIDDIREIADAARYKPVSARYKVYILDEVHMLSKSAFNGLLKTLEEPPAHAKFIFATTEIRKVPITILSRCQRFDLRRVDSAELIKLLQDISTKEGIEIDQESLAHIARAGEGSVRDCLSLLDQAIAYGGSTITSEVVRDMLGLADRARIIDLFEMIASGNIANALMEIDGLYNVGADPIHVITDLAEFTHLITRIKLTPDAATQNSVTEVERTRGSEFAGQLSIRLLTRIWQILTNGLNEVETSPKPLAAAEMLLVRLCHAADLPSPDELIRKLTAEESSENRSPSAHSAPSPPPPEPPAPAPEMLEENLESADQGFLPTASDPTGPTAIKSLTDILNLAEQHREIRLQHALTNHVRLVSMETGRLEIALDEGAPKDCAGLLSAKLKDWSGRQWLVSVVRDSEAPTLREVNAEKKTEQIAQARRSPIVGEILESFPGAEIIDVVDRKDNMPISDVAAGDVSEDSQTQLHKLVE